MAVKSVYLPIPVVEEDRLRIDGDEHRHLVVARAAQGETIEVFDGKGQVWTTEVLTTGRRETVVRVIDSRRVEKAGPELFLGLSLIKPAALELALGKCVEAGVTRIIPVIAARSNVAPGRRSERWNRVIVEAAKQSKRYHLPVVDEPALLAGVLNSAACTMAASKIVFAERGGGPLKSALTGSPALYLVGPEGGWTDGELENVRQKGFQLVGLGDGILRSETAAIVGTALIRYELQRPL
jgi:16S rRNA (uracil1498-N3)-methyltransferase